MEQVLNQILSELKNVNTRLDGLEEGQNQIKSEVAGIKIEVTSLKSEVAGIKSDVNTLKSDVTEIKSDVNNLKSDLTEIKSDVKEINCKADIIFNQTAGLTEFQTEVKHSLNSIHQEVDFICHKEVETEKDVFHIKKHLEIIK